jgi:hypothetical protein
MKRLFSLAGLCLVGLLLLPPLGGCQSKDNVKLTPVHGTITVKGGGKVESGQITFWSTAGKDAKAANPTGEIKGGSYTVSTGGRAGAPDGTYKVTLAPSMATAMSPDTKGPPKMAYNKKYHRQDTTDLNVTVPGKFDLELDP